MSGSTGRGDVGSREAREIHFAALFSDPAHDPVSCWCCCMDCYFDTVAVWDNDAKAGVDSVV